MGDGPRGMQLVDTVFSILPAATLQAYVGMACSSPESQCPGRNGFDALLFLAVLGAITSGTLCFVSLTSTRNPRATPGRSTGPRTRLTLSEMAAKTVFRFSSSARESRPSRCSPRPTAGGFSSSFSCTRSSCSRR